jgi:hypothetical protein
MVELGLRQIVAAQAEVLGVEVQRLQLCSYHPAGFRTARVFQLNEPPEPKEFFL